MSEASRDGRGVARIHMCPWQAEMGGGWGEGLLVNVIGAHYCNKSIHCIKLSTVKP